MCKGPEYHSIQALKMIVVVAVLATISIGFAVGYLFTILW